MNPFFAVFSFPRFDERGERNAWNQHSAKRPAPSAPSAPSDRLTRVELEPVLTKRSTPANVKPRTPPQTWVSRSESSPWARS